MTAGLIMISTGVVLLVAQLMIKRNKPRPKNAWTAKQQKARMIVGGIGLIVLGSLVLLIG